MEIQERRVLVLGGAGLVGRAVCRRLLAEGPSLLVVCSIDRLSAEAAAADLQKEFPSIELRSDWGNVFVRRELKDLGWDQILASPQHRRTLIADTIDPMVGEHKRDILEHSTLAHLFRTHQPDIVVDCVNTATAFAYQNIYDSVRGLQALLQGELDPDAVREAIERHICKLYTPPLVRHIQILSELFKGDSGWRGPRSYVKIGTTGTGGMGINIPYTHGEEKPSSQLLSKTAMAGAHSLLLFLLGRTPPERPTVKEIKPGAAIAWGSIGHGPIRRRGRPVELHDCPPDMAYPLDRPGVLQRQGDFGVRLEGQVLESVYIDTGENGLFSLGEFTTITSLGQMEFVTPEEIAQAVALEIAGGNSGFDVITALDQSVMGPTYRAGLLRSSALARMHELAREHDCESVAFELLGPPRLSKLLFETQILKRVSGNSISYVGTMTQEALSRLCVDEVRRNGRLRQEALSIGIPILLEAGRLLRGPEIKADRAHEGWIDLTPENMGLWQRRLTSLRATVASEIEADSSLGSSRFARAFVDPATGRATDRFDIGEIVGWLFSTEEAGERMKS
jgi:NAD-dependent epimerase/dehydratase family protein